MEAMKYIKMKKLQYLNNEIDLHEYAKALREVWLSESEIQELKAFK
jgi:hypothetical protein